MHPTIILKNQKGSVLLVSLMMLLVLTILAISVMNLSTTSEKLTGNQRDQNIAFQAAESALTDAEGWLKQQVIPPTSTAACNPAACPVFNLNGVSNLKTQNASWWATYGTPYSGKIQQAKTQPRYVIEQYSFIPYDLNPQTRASGRGYYYYRVTAQGNGATDNSKSVVQSIYSIQFN